MPFLDALDDVGIRCVIRPMSLLARLHLLNTFDDIGINLVFRPLRYIHRFAAFLLDSELSTIVTYSDVAGLKADESLVSSTTVCSTSLVSGGTSGSSVSRNSRGRIKKRSRGGSSVSTGSRSMYSASTAAAAGKRRSNGHA
jgi:hypothetical protein